MRQQTYRKGRYTATVFVEKFDRHVYQGIVALDRAAAEPTDDRARVHRAPGVSTTPGEAFDQGAALAHRVLADLDDA